MGNFLAQANCRVVAVCDVRRQHAEQARDRVNQHYKNQDCRTYHDFREVLARPDIDVAHIATPDHWHVPVAIAAAKAGKDMYVEKPLGVTIAEDQLLRKAIHQHHRLFQFGTQQRSSSQFWRACQLVRNGRIGQLRHIDVWCVGSRPGGSTQVVPVPEGLDYEFWLGPAPAKPYTENKCDSADSKTWWYNYDYALGFIAGWGVHPLDIANWGCPSLFAGPLTVEGSAIFPTEGACNTAVAWEVHFACHDGITLRYRSTSNGYNQPTPMTDFADWRKQYGNIVDHGTAFVGTEGWVLVDRTQIRTSPERLVEEKLDAGQVQLLKSDNHAANLVEAARSRGPTVCPIDESVQADLLCHLSDIATRLGRKLTWDPKKERFVKDSEADRRLELRKMRAPWKL
jgi:predicted dehydrogenase